ncbi:hypothetical protein G9A89_010197 [Geosiphon pyriformis]|nr:hypothetical protein G9A89_010197 [Geosiphon pyriformis]
MSMKTLIVLELFFVLYMMNMFGFVTCAPISGANLESFFPKNNDEHIQFLTKKLSHSPISLGKLIFQVGGSSIGKSKTLNSPYTMKEYDALGDLELPVGIPDDFPLSDPEFPNAGE